MNKQKQSGLPISRKEENLKKFYKSKQKRDSSVDKIVEQLRLDRRVIEDVIVQKSIQPSKSKDVIVPTK